MRLWETRYSPTEFLYLELHAAEVRLVLCGFTENVEHWTHAQVLAGEADQSVQSGFSREILDELKTAIRST